MLYEIPFDPAIFRQQCELKYKLVYNKRLKRSKTNLIMSVMIVLIGLSFVREGLALGYFFLSMGLYFVLGSLYFLWQYNKTMKRLRKEDQEMIEQRLKSPRQPAIWEFTGEYFRYKDPLCEHIVKWQACKGYHILERNLFLQMGTSVQYAYILGESELGREEFKKVMDLVITKTQSLNAPK